VTASVGGQIDVAVVRAEHPIEDVVAAAGIELVPRGRGFMCRCPFHDDAAASMSVGGVQDRFHCFGCTAGGDVIDFVQRLHGLSFHDAVATQRAGLPPFARPALAPPPARPVITRERTHEINAMAWERLSRPVAAEFARTYLRRQRGIGLSALEAEFPGRVFAGYASAGWATLTGHLLARGVTGEELLATDLSQRTRSSRLVDTLRDRVVVPVTAPDGGIDGFIGRDTTGDPRAPKYRNPARTATFDKSSALYRPTHHKVAEDGKAVVVEGVLDALALAAPAWVTRLPDGLDPADWLRRNGHPGLAAFDPAAPHSPEDPRPGQPARDLVDLSLARAEDPIRDTIAALVPLALALPPRAATDLLDGAADEMTRRGWNPDGVFARELHRAALQGATHRQPGTHPRTGAPALLPRPVTTLATGPVL
jgi:hypothetical protein